MLFAPDPDRHAGGNKLEPVVFIVNSDEATRTWIESTVVSVGLHAISFGTAEELLSRFDPDTAACVILDVILADASGLEVQNSLARAGASIMFLTREHCISSCVKALKAGAVDFLTMPCDAKQFVCALRDAVGEAVSTWRQREQSDELRVKYERLTAREREIFVLVCSGLLNKQVAQQLAISEITVQIHRGRVMKKMRARSFAALVRMADALQVSPLPTARRRVIYEEVGSTEAVGSTLAAGNTASACSATASSMSRLKPDLACTAMP